MHALYPTVSGHDRVNVITTPNTTRGHKGLYGDQIVLERVGDVSDTVWVVMYDSFAYLHHTCKSGHSVRRSI
jgi:hypothetical protein